ncbi:tyrosine-type recombinase/integrase [Providencia stuartii]|uniref:tyrosine-type recombinase/integrase n=1 Tax=Providencia stuartii TaxID=588 RepID=UPI00280D18D3|nr:tyrosine-type recombinase/integrase [Providencia stuartii]ELR5081569.1 tyrosine-type recombinase/integrase [Providencia stuartii]
MAEINKLTDKKLKAIHGKEIVKPIMIADGRGLSILVSKKGGISWSFSYRRDNKLNRIIIGQYPDLALKQARDKREELRRLLAEGGDPKKALLENKCEDKKITIRDAIEYWLDEYASYNRKNYEALRLKYKKNIYPFIGDLPVEEATTKDWLSCFDKMKDSAPVAAGNLLLDSKQALKYCSVREYAKSDVLALLTVPDVGKKTRKIERVLTDKEIMELLDAINNKQRIDPYYKKLYMVLLIFGARTQEVRLSTWSEWDLKNKIWTVPAGNSKAGNKIQRPIPDKVIEWLKTFQGAENSYILGELKTGSNVSNFCRKLWKRIGQKESWTAHDIRRTFSTKLNDLGQPPHVVEQLLGHIMGGVMAVYNRSQYMNEKKATLNTWLNELEKYGLTLK